MNTYQRKIVSEWYYSSLIITCPRQNKSRMISEANFQKQLFLYLPISKFISTKNDCCADFKTATTVNADLIVKFGFSCMYDNQKDIQVLYVFDHFEDVNCDKLHNTLTDLNDKTIVG